MRLNKYLAASTNLSRRTADKAIASGKVTVNGKTAEQGADISETDVVTLEGLVVRPAIAHTTIVLNKPVGVVVSRKGQGSRTIYDILPEDYHRLNPVGRLDKDSSGLLLLTDDGNLANDLTHPSRQKVKVYEVTLDKPLEPLHQQMISDYGIVLEDGLSRFLVSRSEAMPHPKATSPLYEIQMSEGRNRQIRRTFQSLGYNVITLHRTHFGPYTLGDLEPGYMTVLKG